MEKFATWTIYGTFVGGLVVVGAGVLNATMDPEISEAYNRAADCTQRKSLDDSHMCPPRDEFAIEQVRDNNTLMLAGLGIAVLGAVGQTSRCVRALDPEDSWF